MKPEHNCPACPKCGARCGVPVEAADWNHRAGPLDRIACPTCGTGWRGTDAEVEQARTAQAAWEAIR